MVQCILQWFIWPNHNISIQVCKIKFYLKLGHLCLPWRKLDGSIPRLEWSIYKTWFKSRKISTNSLFTQVVKFHKKKLRLTLTQLLKTVWNPFLNVGIQLFLFSILLLFSWWVFSVTKENSHLSFKLSKQFHDWTWNQRKFLLYFLSSFFLFYIHIWIKLWVKQQGRKRWWYMMLPP